MNSVSELPHQPVLRAEVLALLDPQPHETAIDATVGAGGHALALLTRTAPDGRLLALDRDPAALAIARRTLRAEGSRVTFVHAPFSALAAAAHEHGFGPVDLMLFDLGLSSMQLNDPRRGFSFQVQGPLDMRMDPCHQRETAADLVNQLPFPKLRSILLKYGEEPHAGSIAHAIVAERQKQKVSTTHHLLAVLDQVRTIRRRWHHPATLTFQALRLAVNRELEELQSALPQALGLLKPGGRLAVIAFHSLEDRLVKEFFRAEARGCRCPPELPVCTCGHRPVVSLLTRRAIRPSADEVSTNPRSRSAKLRAIRKRIPT